MQIPFVKMQGAGNDFIVVDVRDWNMSGADSNAKEDLEQAFLQYLSNLTIKLCKRRFFVGADGLMAVISPKADGDFGMLFFNADGSQAEMCGNGARCIARYGFDRGMAGTSDMIKIETTAGVVYAWRMSGDIYRVRLNTPSVIKLNLFDDVSYVELGNPGIPHAVTEMQGVGEIMKKLREGGDLPKYLSNQKALYARAKALRFHEKFAKGANVNFYEIIKDGEIALLTFERGVEDFTLACGTGTASTALVIHMLKNNMQKGIVTVHSAGGTLRTEVEQKDGDYMLYQSGSAVTVAEGIAFI